MSTPEDTNVPNLREMTCGLEDCERSAAAYYPASDTARCADHLPTDNPTLAKS